MSPVLHIPVATSGTPLLFTNGLLHMLRNVSLGITSCRLPTGFVLGVGGDGQCMALERGKPSGRPPAKALMDEAWVLREHEGASWRPQNLPGVGVAGIGKSSQRR